VSSGGRRPWKRSLSGIGDLHLNIRVAPDLNAFNEIPLVAEAVFAASCGKQHRGRDPH